MTSRQKEQFLAKLEEMRGMVGGQAVANPEPSSNPYTHTLLDLKCGDVLRIAGRPDSPIFPGDSVECPECKSLELVLVISGS